MFPGAGGRRGDGATERGRVCRRSTGAHGRYVRAGRRRPRNAALLERDEGGAGLGGTEFALAVSARPSGAGARGEEGGREGARGAVGRWGAAPVPRSACALVRPSTYAASYFRTRSTSAEGDAGRARGRHSLAVSNGTRTTPRSATGLRAPRSALRENVARRPKRRPSAPDDADPFSASISDFRSGERRRPAPRRPSPSPRRTLGRRRDEGYALR